MTDISREGMSYRMKTSSDTAAWPAAKSSAAFSGTSLTHLDSVQWVRCCNRHKGPAPSSGLLNCKTVDLCSFKARVPFNREVLSSGLTSPTRRTRLGHAEYVQIGLLSPQSPSRLF